MNMELMKIKMELDTPIFARSCCVREGGFAFKLKNNKIVDFDFSNLEASIQDNGTCVCIKLRQFSHDIIDSFTDLNVGDLLNPEDIVVYDYDFYANPKLPCSRASKLLWCEFTIEGQDYAIPMAAISRFNQSLAEHRESERLPIYHYVKCLPEFFNRLDVVSGGPKNFEIRKNDRGYKVGDLVTLMEWSPENGYSGESVTVTIKWLMKDCPEFGLLNGFCIFNW